MEQDPQVRVQELEEVREPVEVLVPAGGRAEVAVWAEWVARVQARVAIVFARAAVQRLHTRQAAHAIICSVQNAGQLWYGNK